MISSVIIGFFASVYLIFNTLFWCIFLYLIAGLKFFFRFKKVNQLCTRSMAWIAETWISGNVLGFYFFYRIHWDIRGTENLSPQKSYLVISNHQSWVDIAVIQKTLNRKVPFVRFFLKQQLIYVPLLGLAWWALDFPFMKRHSKAVLARHPEKRAEDLETTRQACRRFSGIPVSILNFLEGTRFTKEKHQAQKSPFRHLLRPKAGGLAFVIEAMPSQFESILDMTLFYPSGPPSFLGLLAGHFRRVLVEIEEIQIPPDLKNGNYLEDSIYRERFQKWVFEIWQKKDQKIETMKQRA